MEQRPLRLGDIVDDYCPRERRVTNHAIVAIVENAIRQTRCSTCDADHVYKGGTVPRRRLNGPSASDRDVENPPGQLVAPREVEDDPVMSAAASPATADGDVQSDRDGDRAEGVVAENTVEEASLHRPLIRATLPRIEGEPSAPRPIPEFTMHQRPQQRGGWRGNGFGRNGNGQGGFNGGNGRQGRQHGQGSGRHDSKNRRGR